MDARSAGSARGGRAPAQRLLTYAIVGWAFDVAFSTAHDAARRKPLRLRTSPWMFAIYALMLPLFEPVHDRLRGRAPAVVRGAIYGVGIMSVEYVTGRAIRDLTGKWPWDYRYAKRHIDGLVRPDYFPMWAAVGLGAERLHDRLVGRSA